MPAVAAEVIELTKPCTKCGDTKPFSDFYMSRREADGKTDWCKVCMNGQGARYRAANPTCSHGNYVKRVARFDEEAAKAKRGVSKRCCTCKVEKPLSDFTKDRNTSWGLSARCRPCNSDRALAWRKENPQRARRVQKMSFLRRKYGISEDALHALVEAQGGKCGICRDMLDMGRHTCIDHNHETGAVRGLLCRKCNSGIGQLRDSQEIVRAALHYLIDREGER